MIWKLSCLLIVSSMAAACGTADPESAGTAGPDQTVNALEASGQVEFFVRVVGANGQVFNGESTNRAFLDSIPAIRYFSDVNKGQGALSRTRCTAFRFTKVVGAASPQLVGALASGETLRSVHFDFIRFDNSVFQEVDLAGVRISKVEQAVAPPDNLSPSVLLEEVTLVPTGTATVTLTANPLNADGSPAASIVTTFTCNP